MTPTETFDNLTKTNSALAAAKSAFIDQCNAISPSKTNAEIAAQALPYGPIAVGMPVIAGHSDRPCTRLVAVVVGFTADGRAW